MSQNFTVHGRQNRKVSAMVETKDGRKVEAHIPTAVIELVSNSGAPSITLHLPLESEADLKAVDAVFQQGAEVEMGDWKQTKAPPLAAEEK